MVKITLLDGEEITIRSNTVVNGYNKTADDPEYYMVNVFTDSIDGQFSKDGSRIATVNPMVGILGFILSVDAFSFGLDTKNNVLYLSTAVKSVRNV